MLFSKTSLSIVCTFVSEGQEVSGAGISHNLNLSLNNMHDNSEEDHSLDK